MNRRLLLSTAVEWILWKFGNIFKNTIRCLDLFLMPRSSKFVSINLDVNKLKFLRENILIIFSATN